MSCIAHAERHNVGGGGTVIGGNSGTIGGTGGTSGTNFAPPWVANQGQLLCQLFVLTMVGVKVGVAVAVLRVVVEPFCRSAVVAVEERVCRR
jgi:hypothetical protein